MRLEEVEEAYLRLSMLHSETMLDNVQLRRQLATMSGDWRRQLMYNIKLKLGIIKPWGEE
jgi:hypothetical protein